MKFICVPQYPDYCLVKAAYNTYEHGHALGTTSPEDPIYVYKGRYGVIFYLTGTDMTTYYRFIVKLVMPNIQ